MAHLVEVKDVYKIYNPGENEVRALDGVSLTIDKRGICCNYRTVGLR